MLNSPIDLNTESGEPHFENETMVAMKSNHLKHNTMIGSYVIVPKSEVRSPFDLTEKEWADSRELMLKVKKYIDKTYKPDGYNIGWNVGETAGQSVAHTHMHIIPRYADEPYAGKGLGLPLLISAIVLRFLHFVKKIINLLNFDTNL